MLVLGGGRGEEGGVRGERGEGRGRGERGGEGRVGGRGRVRGYVCVQYMQVAAYSYLGVRPRVGSVDETGNGCVCPSPG